MANSRSEFTPTQRMMGRVHGWLGLGSIAFVLLLSTTGIVLNHKDDLGLNRTYLNSSWLLHWYGFELPDAVASFATSTHRVTLLGARLYFDGGELAEGVAGLVGVVSTPSFTAVATPDDLLLVSADGDLVERIDTRDFFSNEMTGVGIAGDRLILRSDSALYETDENFLSFDPCLESDVTEIHWAAPSAIPQDDLQTLQELYRGRGITVEQFILDLHSGKVLTRFGPALIDVAGGLFIVLSMLGLGMWYGRRRHSN